MISLYEIRITKKGLNNKDLNDRLQSQLNDAYHQMP